MVESSKGSVSRSMDEAPTTMIKLDAVIRKSITSHSRSVDKPSFLLLRQEWVFSKAHSFRAPCVAGLPYSQIAPVRVCNPELRLCGDLEVVSVIEVDVRCVDTSP